MKTAAVVIDDWKLPIFKRRLDDAGCAYTEGRGVTAGTLILRVQYKWLADLKPIVEAANNEARAQGKPKS